MKNLLDYIKQFPIFWINMDSAVQRKSNMENLFERLDLDNTRISGVPCDTVIEGCAKSQLSILENNEPPFIILEDDCGLIEKSLNHSIDESVNMDCLYLGMSAWGMSCSGQNNYRMSRMTEPTFCDKTDNPNMIKIHHMLSTHAILYNTKSYVNRVISEMKKYQNMNWHCDVACAEIQKDFDVYALNPPLFYQDDASNRPYTQFELSFA